MRERETREREMQKGEDEESKEAEWRGKRRDSERKREREGGRIGILLISPLRALDKRGMRMTLALYSPSYYPYDRADLAFYLVNVFCSISHLRVAAMKIST